MKKLLSILLAFCMLFILASCAAEEPSPVKDPDPIENPGSNNEVVEDIDALNNSTYEGVDAPDGFKIGFSYLPPTDTLGGAFHRMLDYCAEEFNCEMMYAEWTSFDIDSISASYENLVQTGCDGVIPVILFPGMVDTFIKNEVYFMPTACVVDESMLPMCLESEYYLGSITGNDFASGYQLGQNLYNAGCRNVVFCGPAPGNEIHDNRHRGFMQFVEEHEDFNLVVESRDGATTGVYDELIAAHGPKIDGIAASGGSAALPAAIISAGYENDIKYTSIDIQGDIQSDLASGMCVGVGDGNYPVVQLSFAILYNAMASGEQIMLDRSQPLHIPFIWITNAEEYEYYKTYMEGAIPAFTGDELKELCYAYNPDATPESIWEKLQSYVNDYSLENLIERHSQFYK